MSRQDALLSRLRTLTGLWFDDVDVKQLSITGISNAKVARCDGCAKAIQNRTAYLLMRSDRTYKATIAVLCESCQETLDGLL